MSSHNRILHVDGDSFFASCEVVLNSELQARPVWGGGGRRGDGIVIAANRLAKKFGVKTGMACFEAARLCPKGVLCRPHYDEYRRLSQEMFRILEEYSPKNVGLKQWCPPKKRPSGLSGFAEKYCSHQPVEGEDTGPESQNRQCHQ
jgi:hypothetical protein